MAAGSTYTPIATQTLGGSTNGITFSSIPSTYTDLVLVATGTRGSGGDAIKVRLNGDTTASNYSNTDLTGNGTSATSGRNGTLYGYFENVGFFNQTPSTLILQFNSYSNTGGYKVMIGRNGNSGFWTNEYVGLYKSNSAINSIFVNMNDMAAGTTMTLYGITAA
jgi:hypothetical protein